MLPTRRVLPAPRPIPGLNAATLATVREALEHAVRDPQGTAHDSLGLARIAVAAKTGTAETGEPGADHAWLAGYAPADRPRVAFVVALERCGDAAEHAGPVAQRLVLSLEQLGYLRP